MRFIRSLRRIRQRYSERRSVITLDLAGPELSRTRLTCTARPREHPANRQPYRLNAPGPFYSVRDCCIICLAPHAVAPNVMGFYQDPSGTNRLSHCFFKRQREAPKELDEAIAAMRISCIENLRYRGDDPAILQRLCDMGLRQLCDAFDDGQAD